MGQAKLTAASPPRYLRYLEALNLRTKFAIAGSPFRASRLVRSIDQLLRLGDYVRTSGLGACPYFSRRSQLYEHVHRTLIGDQPIDFLEFGVFTGTSMRDWVALNQHAGSRFFGFDSFEGLPEKWEFATSSLEAGYFSTGGRMPNIEDSRVRFIKGWFQDTVGAFVDTFERKNQLVIHCDADLYTSTLFVLATLNDYIQPGTIVVFDEFGSVSEEFRAFIDYTRSFRKQFVPIGWAGKFYEQVAFSVAELSPAAPPSGATDSGPA